MKLPGFVVIAMLVFSVPIVSAAGGWLWVTWPERTAREYCDLIRDGRFREAARMVEPPFSDRVMEYMNDVDLDNESRPMVWFDLYLHRDLSDFLMARRRFTMTCTCSHARFVEWCKVERGTVRQSR